MLVFQILGIDVGELAGADQPFRKDVPGHDAECVGMGLPRRQLLSEVLQHRQREGGQGNLHRGLILSVANNSRDLRHTYLCGSFLPKLDSFLIGN